MAALQLNSPVLDWDGPPSNQHPPKHKINYFVTLRVGLECPGILGLWCTIEGYDSCAVPALIGLAS